MTGPPESGGAGDEGAALAASAAPFIHAVLTQVGRARDRLDPATDILREATAGRLTRVLDAAASGRAEAAAALLAADPLLLSSVFQNADLLYLHGDPRADMVGRATLTATYLAAEPHEPDEGRGPG